MTGRREAAMLPSADRIPWALSQMMEERMESLTVDQLRQVAKFQGYAWTDAEIERLRQQIDRGLALVEKLSALISKEVEPATQYRMF